MKTIKISHWTEVPIDFTGIVEYKYGPKYWYKQGKPHREDGPAIERTDGSKEWWVEDKQYFQIIINDFVVLDYYKGEYNLIWYKLLNEDKIIDYPDIPRLIQK